MIRLPSMSPNLNAYAERFVRSIKHECLNRMIFVEQASLRRAMTDYVQDYHQDRNHQGLDNNLIRPCSADAFVVVSALVAFSTSITGSQRERIRPRLSAIRGLASIHSHSWRRR